MILYFSTLGFYLYLIQPRGKAMRYGVGLGRAGFEWSGRGVIQWKQEWPTWTPPAEMIARQPELEKYSAENGGMAPGLNNPLGARALYIFQDGEDTLYGIKLQWLEMLGNDIDWAVAITSGSGDAKNMDCLCNVWD